MIGAEILVSCQVRVASISCAVLKIISPKSKAKFARSINDKEVWYPKYLKPKKISVKNLPKAKKSKNNTNDKEDMPLKCL